MIFKTNMQVIQDGAIYTISGMDNLHFQLLRPLWIQVGDKVRTLGGKVVKITGVYIAKESGTDYFIEYDNLTTRQIGCKEYLESFSRKFYTFLP